MTELQAISHAEQMEAIRKDFNAYWESEVVPLMKNKQLTDCAKTAIKNTFWISFKGLKLFPNKPYEQ